MESDSGQVKSIESITPSGSALQSIHGRYLPQRVFVLSAITPIATSDIPSPSRATSMSVPTAAGLSPNTSV